MKSPWRVDSPFEIMYDECVVFATADGSATRTVPCCVFLDETGSALSDLAEDTTREDILVALAPGYLDYARTLRRGHRITRPETNRKAYTVQSVDWDHVLGLVVKARSV